MTTKHGRSRSRTRHIEDSRLATMSAQCDVVSARWVLWGTNVVVARVFGRGASGALGFQMVRHVGSAGEHDVGTN